MMIDPGRTYFRLAHGSVGWLTLARRWNCSGADVVVTIDDGRTVDQFLDAALLELTNICAEDPMACPAIGLAVVLALWDCEFREAGLLDGNVYLASHTSVPALLEVAGWGAPRLNDPRVLEQLLRTMLDGDLLYDFPVASKFRERYGTDRQLRLNGWGRELAERVRTTQAFDQSGKTAQSRIRTHLAVHRRMYARHMETLTQLGNVPPGAPWRSASSLPVAVLS